MAKGLRSKASEGLKWNSYSTFLKVLIQFLQLAILTRILEPSDYGLVAMTSIFMSVVTLFVDFGIGNSIIHKEESTKKELSSLFWFNIFTGLIGMVLIIMVCRPIAEFYHEPKLIAILLIAGVSLFLSSFGLLYNSILLKAMMHRARNKIIIITQISILIFSVILALNGFGVYSLVIPNILASIISSALYMKVSRSLFIPSFHYSFKEIKPHLNFGIYQSAEGAINIINSQIDSLILGKLLGKEVLGGYYVAKNLANKPIQLINPVITNVSLPILAQVNMRSSSLKYFYLKSLRFIANINFPIFTMLFIYSDEIVAIVYGEKWAHIVPALKLFCIYFAFRGLINPIGSLVVATGKPKFLFNFNLLFLIINPIGLFWSSRYGIDLVIITLTSINIVFFVVHFIMILKPLLPNLSFGELLGSFRRQLIMSVAVIYIPVLFNFDNSLIVKILITALYILLIWNATDSQLKKQIFTKLRIK